MLILYLALASVFRSAWIGFAKVYIFGTIFFLFFCHLTERAQIFTTSNGCSAIKRAFRPQFICSAYVSIRNSNYLSEIDMEIGIFNTRQSTVNVVTFFDISLQFRVTVCFESLIKSICQWNLHQSFSQSDFGRVDKYWLGSYIRVNGLNYRILAWEIED